MICDKIKQCSTLTSDARKTLEDKKGCKSKLLIENNFKTEYSIIDFEAGVFNNEASKCDFGVLTNDKIFYIELKGSDVKKGIEQLLETINATERCFSTLDFKARLIVSKFQSPKIVKNTKEYKDLVKKLKHIPNQNDNLVITQNVYTDKI